MTIVSTSDVHHHASQYISTNTFLHQFRKLILAPEQFMFYKVQHAV